MLADIQSKLKSKVDKYRCCIQTKSSPSTKMYGQIKANINKKSTKIHY